MDKTTERETRDFMSVESFSQLPFIRSTPPLARDKGGAGGIRLFGQEFGSRKNSTDDQSDSDNDNLNAQEGEAANNGSDGTEGAGSSSRKFECHYCCRNFPTSQALGGHQNAHKRERQQAKRAHLQSAMLHGGLPDSHVYGLMSYNRLGTAPPLPVAYHSWSGGGGSSAYNASSRIYGGYGAVAAQAPQPINGSPLAYWRVPTAQSQAVLAGRNRPAPPSAFAFKDEMKPAFPSSMSSMSGSQFQFGYESKAKMQEQVSLDLHL